MDHLVQRYTGWIEKYCLVVIVVVTLLVAGLGLGLSRLTFTSDYRVYFGEDNPQREVYEQFEKTYAQTDNILIVVRPEYGNVFTPEVLHAVREMTEAAWQIPHSIRVDSITNFQDIRADGDDLIVEDLVPESLNRGDVADIRRTALDTPTLVGNLVAPDGGATGINVTLQFPGEEHHAHLIQTVEASRELVERSSSEYPDLTIVQTGIAPLGYAEYAVSER
ncbi:MAG: hypothetical protein HUJ31_08540, partial [Pseudomonadales bacterium]|nr:hypothetical protein [Pseudomonadales bacterium]